MEASFEVPLRFIQTFLRLTCFNKYVKYLVNSLLCVQCAVYHRDLRAQRLPLLKSGAYTPEAIATEQTQLEAKLETLRQEEAVSEEAMRELIKEVVTLSELIKNVVPVYDFATPREKEQIIKVIFSELFISHDTLQYKLKKGFETFDKRIDVLCGPTRTRTSVNGFGIRYSTTELWALMRTIYHAF